jgi:hypothetical protein
MPVPDLEMASAMTEPEPEPPKEDEKPAASANPSKLPVDIDLGIGDTAAADSKEEPKPTEEDDFIETVVIPPNAGARNEEKSRNSTDAFIARVKQQLSSSDSMAESGNDFTSTIPQ